MRAMLLAAIMIVGGCSQEASAPQAGQTEPPALAPVALPQSDAAGNQLVALEQIGEGGLYCAGGEAWCLTAPEDSAVAVSRDGGDSFVLPARGAMWTNAILSPGAAIVGVIETQNQMYSGGSGSAQHLVLYRIADGPPTEVARLPYAGNVDIRACFSEDDRVQRADACSDEYLFVSRVRLDEAVTSGAPHIVLETAAATFPGRVTRGADSLERAALTQADLVWATDEVCSFRRTYAPTSTGPYVPDTELPACTDYLEP